MPKHCIKRWLTIHQQFCRQIDKQNCYKREREHTAIHPFHLTKDEFFFLLVKNEQTFVERTSKYFSKNLFMIVPLLFCHGFRTRNMIAIFAESETTELGVAFSNEGVLVLLEKRPEK